MMTSFTQEQIEAALEAKSRHLNQYDLRQISGAKEAVMKMVAEFPSKWEKSQRQAKLLFEMIEAAANGKLAVHPDDLRYAGGALVYLGDSLDIVPDDQEDGYADDAAIVALAISKSVEHVKKYCAAKGLNAAEYID
jgi:uncharacterized membrane protein YkvA (DUF1232 family)